MFKFPGGRGPEDRNLSAILAAINQLEPAIRRDDRARQFALVRTLIELRAPMGEQWHALAGVMIRSGELALARKAIDLFVEACGHAPQALYAKAALLEQCGDYAEVYAIMRSLPLAQDRAMQAYSRAAVAITLGETADAREQIEVTLSLRPQMGQAWLLLATLADFAAEPELITRIIAAEQGLRDAPPLQRGPFCYALGQALDAAGEHTAAFAAFAEGGRAQRACFGYDREADRAHAAEAVRGYDARLVADLAARQGEPTDRAIFVTGLPRSGTTLVEQILARHSGVGSAGEAELLWQLAREMGGASADVVARHVGTHGTGPITAIWNGLLQQRVPGDERVVIKALNTSRYAGIAAALLPESPVVWLTRDPLDRAWSCFRSCFNGAQPWSDDLADMAFRFRLEDELLRQWQGILGERVLQVPLEGLAADPEEWIPKIATHCGLSTETALFSPHQSGLAVKTASVMQVRRPINRSGIGVAEPYRAMLAPFSAAYGA